MATIRLPIGQFGGGFSTQRELPSLPPFSFLRPLSASEQIYVSSASAISIDTPLSSSGSDSGIYNTSTVCSSCSGGKVQEGRPWVQTVRTHYPDVETLRDYEWQDVSVWVNTEEGGDHTEHPEEEEEEEEEVYETIYDVIGRETQDSDFDDISDMRSEHRHGRTKNLTKLASNFKIASAAGRKIKKLRRNWSLKKNDFTRSLSKIRRASQSSQSSQFYVEDSDTYTAGGAEEDSDTYTAGGVGENCDIYNARGVRQDSDTFTAGDAVTAGCVELTGLDNTSFTVSLTVELPSDTYMQMTARVHLRSPHQSPSVTGNRPADPPCRPSRRKSRRNTQVIRPSVPPPAPPLPPPLPLSPPPVDASSPQPPPVAPKPANLKLAAKQPESMPPGRSRLEGSYAYLLLNTEPLYQFYTGYINKPAHPVHVTPDHTYESVHYAGLSRQDGQTTGQLNWPTTSDISAIQPTSDIQPVNPSNQLPTSEIQPVNRSSVNNIAQVNRSSVNDIQPVNRPSTSDHRWKTTPEGSGPAGQPLRTSALALLGAHGRRTLWSEIPEVLHSGLLARMNDNQRKLQEAKFEILASEASYLKSLNVLTSHFLPSLTASGSATEQELSSLFCHVNAVRSSSERFLAELDLDWRESCLLPGVIRILGEYGRRHFKAYIQYCSDQLYQDKTLRKLQSDNAGFVDNLRVIEAAEVCQSLSLHSFLMLPMQRVTRLPLLVAALQSRLQHNTEEHRLAGECLEVLNSLVEQCNEAARHTHRMEELTSLSKVLDFRDLKPLVLISTDRWLVKQGQAVRVQWKEGSESVRLTFGKRNHKQTLVLLLFSDLLVIAKKKSDDKLAVIDYCNRNLVQLSSLTREESPIPGLPENCHPSWLSLLQNNESKTQEMLLYFSTEVEREKWISLLTSNPTQVGGELVYAEWDTPIVEIIQPVSTGPPPPLLRPGDRARVLRKKEELLLVEKIGHKKRTWVSVEKTRELCSDHLRARNFKQRYNFLKSLNQCTGP